MAMLRKDSAFFQVGRCCGKKSESPMNVGTSGADGAGGREGSKGSSQGKVGGVEW